MQMMNKIKWSHLFLQFLRFFLWNNLSSVSSENLSFANLLSNKKPKSSLRDFGLTDSHLWQSNDSRIFCGLTLRRMQLSFLSFSHKFFLRKSNGGAALAHGWFQAWNWKHFAWSREKQSEISSSPFKTSQKQKSWQKDCNLAFIYKITINWAAFVKTKVTDRVFCSRLQELDWFRSIYVLWAKTEKIRICICQISHKRTVRKKWPLATHLPRLIGKTKTNKLRDLDWKVVLQQLVDLDTATYQTNTSAW